MDKLLEILEESAELYKNFLELEYKKYDTVIKNDIDTLDDIVSKEQVFYLQMRGNEQKREKVICDMGYKDMSLKEIIQANNKADTCNLNDKYEDLCKLITDVKKISNLCKTLLEVRMHRIDKVMKQLGEEENTYSNKQVSGKAKSLILSKRI